MIADKLLVKFEEDMLKVAQRLLAKGMSTEDVAETTELSLDIVKDLQDMQLQRVTVN